MVDSGRSLSHYTIIRPLGKGGMGEVFLAEDTVLGRKVALKFLAKDAIQDPVARSRFLREAKSAAAIDDPFICKIYETGEVDGEPFIAMEYIEGESLADRIDRGPMSLEEVVTTASEVAEALGVAHENGIIHRDLKPSNIMLTTQGHAKVLDFGLAKQVFTPGNMDTSAETASSDDLTGRGVTLGTLTYMSPEQLRALPLTPRSDVFSFGIVLHEMLTGEHPFIRPTSPATVNAIMADPAPTPASGEEEIPPALLAIHEKALAKNLEDRYLNATEIVQDLGEVRQAIAPMKKATHTIGIAMAIVLAAIVVVAGLRLLPRTSGPVPVETPDPMSVLIADFENATGDEVFDGALEQALAIGLEEAPFISSYRRGRARQVAEQIQGEGTGLDTETARLVAQREAINVVMVGSIAPADPGFRITVGAVDSHTGEIFVSNENVASGKDQVLPAVAELTIRVRQALGDTTPESVLLAAKETFTAGSLEAAAAYSEAQELMGVGRWSEALEEYRRAVQLDPDMGRAYAGAAVCFANLGRREEAEEQFQLAMVHIDRMTDREKLRSRGAYYLMTRNYAKAVDEYTALLAEYPYDAAGLNNLPLAHFYGRDMALAVEKGRRTVEIYPEHVMPRANLALYSMYAGEFSAAMREASTVLEANPNYELAHVAMALSELARGNVEAASGRYETLRLVSAWGASLAASGLADLALYQGRLEDAALILERGIRGDRAADNQGEAARKLAVLAGTLAKLGRSDEATAAADEAIVSSRREAVLLPAAAAYLELGLERKALALADDLGSRIGPEPQVYAQLITALVEIENERPQAAVTLAGDAQRILDTWLGRFILGRAYLGAGAFTEAHSELERCLERRGEATALFLDDVPTNHYLPPVHYWLGRSLEGLGSSAADDAYRTFIELRKPGANDVLVDDARRRLGSAS